METLLSMQLLFLNPSEMLPGELLDTCLYLVALLSSQTLQTMKVLWPNHMTYIAAVLDFSDRKRVLVSLTISSLGFLFIRFSRFLLVIFMSMTNLKKVLPDDILISSGAWHREIRPENTQWLSWPCKHMDWDHFSQ